MMSGLSGIQLRTLLETTERRDDLIPGLIRADGITLLTAPPKIGKTMFACQVALAALDGRSFLGFPAGPAVDVLYCDIESSNDELKQRFNMLRGDSDDPYALDFCRGHFQLAKEDDVNALIELVIAGKYKLVVIDTLATYMLGVDENDAGAVSKPLHGLRRLQHETGAAILVVAHAPKSENNGRISAKTRGSNAITAAASTLMVLSGSGKKGKLAIEQRFAATSSIALLRRPDGFWERDPKEVQQAEAA
jgi:RecA-family ATPase